MTKAQAQRSIEELLESENFKYIFQKRLLIDGQTHLTFKMDSGKYELQMALDYLSNFVDILLFINPIVVNAEHYLDTLRAINLINNWAKAFGRFYIDENMDIAYSLRISYALLEQMPEMVLEQIDAGIKYYEDIFFTIIDVTTGKATFEECRNFIDEMWAI